MSNNSLIGQTIGKYKIVEHLGRGGMAEVYKAYHENLDRYVAIKLMHPFLADDKEFLGRFQREARAMAAISHPNIVDVFDFDVQDGTYYIVMAYISGGTLKEKIEELAVQGVHMELTEAIQIVLEVADALAFAHSRGMLHRDIKPANIMLNERGAAVLTDFGIAKMMSGPSHTATGAMIGTPSYMSPEQGLGQPGDERSDLYSLGVLFYQLVTGKLPYDADTPLAVVLQHVNNPVPDPRLLNPDLPDLIEEVLYRTLAKKPEERFPSVHEFARELRQAVRQTSRELGTALPAALLQDKPTPLPSRTAGGRSVQTAVSQPNQTMLANPAEATQMVAGNQEATQVGDALGVSATVVDPSPTTSHTPSRSWWPMLIGLLAVVALVVAGVFVFGGGGGEVGEPTVDPAAVAGLTTTTAPATAVPTVADEPTPEEEIDLVATQVAAINATLTAQAPTPTTPATETPTATPSATPTITPTPTPTIDPTVAFLDSCTTSYALQKVFVGTNQNNLFAAVNLRNTLTLVLSNTGTCPLEQGLVLAYVEGTEFSFSSSDPITLPTTVAATELVTLTAQFTPPSQVRTYETVWQLQTAAGEPVGEPFTFAITTFVPVTPTPTRPPATATPAVSPTPTAGAVNVDFNVFFTNCEYPGGGSEWRCQMNITPFGGAGSQYTIFVFDSEPPARYLGGNQTHFITARRCAPWIHEVKVQDEASGAQKSRNIYFDPTTQALFPGGTTCTLP